MPSASRIAPGSTPLVGRDVELRRLIASLDRARRGAGRLVLIAGEPGIGKTRLARETSQRAEADGLQVAWGHAFEGGGAAPYDPWLQIVRGLGAPTEEAHLLVDLSAALHGTSPTPMSGAADAAHVRFQLFDAVASALRRLAAAAPLVLVLDDLHWADQASHLLLHFLARELTDAPVLLIATMRDVEMRREAGPSLAGDLAAVGDVVALSGLSEAEVARLVADHTGDDAPASLCSAIHQASDGNPFFVRELVRMMAAEPALAADRDVPDSVRELLRRRMRPLRAATRALLEVAAVVGREFDVATVARVAALAPADVLEAFDDAAHLAVVTAVPDTVGAYRFAHTLVRQAVYADVGADRRAALHGRVGDLLEALPPAQRTARVGEIARHFLACADRGHVERAGAHARAAGDHALSRYAYEEAAHYFSQALDAHATGGGPVAERIRLLLRRADAWWRADDARARSGFLEAAALARPTDAALFAAAAAGYAYTFESDSVGIPDPTMLALLEEALAVVPAGADALRAQIMARIALASSFDPTAVERRLALSDEALALARRSGDATALQRALLVRHFMLLAPGDVGPALRLCTELLTTSEATGHVVAAMQARMLRVPLLIQAGDTAAADLDIAAAFATAESTRLPAFRWLARSLRAMRALMTGRLDDAERWTVDSMTFLPEVQDPYPPQAVATHFFFIRREQGRTGELAGQLTMLADMVVLPIWRCALALIHAELGDLAAARAELTAIGGQGFADFPRDGTWLAAMAMAAEATHRAGAVEHAAALYAQLLPFEAAPIMSASAACLGVTGRYLGLLALTLHRWDDAVRHLDGAVARLLHIDDRVQLAHARFETAVALQRRRQPGDLTRAASSAATAAAAAHDFGLSALAARIAACDFAVAPASAAPTVLVATLRRDGDSWLVGWTHDPQRLADSKGVRYLARLLARPAVAVDAAALVVAEAPAESPSAEHARVNVTRRLRQAIDRVGALAPDLGRHLATSVRTGTRCVYEPDPRQPVAWVL